MLIIVKLSGWFELIDIFDEIILLKQFLSFVFLIAMVQLTVAQNILSGIVITENGLRIPNAIVVNLSTNEKTLTNSFGEFKINSQYNQKIRFVKENYDRETLVVNNQSYVEVTLIKNTQEIEEVAISPFKITGNINDASQIRIDHSKEKLRQDIGLPKAPEKPRERAPEVKDVLAPLLFAQLNVDALYKVVSGKAKKMKRQYRYEDQQDQIDWIKINLGEDYLLGLGLPKESISTFLQYCLSDAEVLRYTKAKNTSGVMISIEKHLPQFLERLSDLKH